MQEYCRKIEHLEGVGEYSSGFGDFSAVTHLARIAVVGPHEETVWEKSVRDRIISFAIPIPYFEKRIARAVQRADGLVESLNGTS